MWVFANIQSIKKKKSAYNKIWNFAPCITIQRVMNSSKYLWVQLIMALFICHFHWVERALFMFVYSFHNKVIHKLFSTLTSIWVFLSSHL